MTTNDELKFPSVSAHSGKVVLGASEALTPKDARKIAAELVAAARDAESQDEDLIRRGDVFDFHLSTGSLHFVNDAGQLVLLGKNGKTGAASLCGVTRLSALDNTPTLIRRGTGTPITK